MKKLLLTTAFLMATVSAQAATVFDGVTYSLSGVYTNIDQSSAHFTLTITGINGAADTEKGRYGVNAYAFNKPANFDTASSPGFTLEVGGLNSSGCNGAGNFFCFNDNLPKPAAPPLPANSSLTFEFDLSVLTGFTLATYNPDFKIDWLGTKNNYDLISKNLPLEGGSIQPLSEVPIPGAVWLFGSALIGLGALTRRKRKQHVEAIA